MSRVQGILTLDSNPKTNDHRAIQHLGSQAWSIAAAMWVCSSWELMLGSTPISQRAIVTNYTCQSPQTAVFFPQGVRTTGFPGWTCFLDRKWKLLETLGSNLKRSLESQKHELQSAGWWSGHGFRVFLHVF